MSRRRLATGSLYQRRDGYWAASVDFGRIEGQRVRRVAYAKTKNQAKRLRARLLHDLDNGVTPEAFKITLGELVERWLNECVRPVARYSTFLTAKSTVNRYLIRYLGHATLASLTPLVIQGFYAHLLRDGHSVDARRRAHKYLKSVMRLAVRWEFIRLNPCDHVSVPKRQRREMQIWTPEEVVRFLRCARSDRLFSLYVLAITTGMRRGELLALRWADIDWKSSILKIRQSLGRVESGWGLTDVKTKSSRRAVQVPKWAMQALKKHKKEMQAEGHRASLVFVGKRGRAIQPTCLLDDHFHPLVAKAKVPQVRFHDLRHTSATLLMAEGVQPEIVAKRLGHSKPSITVGLYTHSYPYLEREAARKLDKYVADLGLSIPSQITYQYL